MTYFIKSGASYQVSAEAALNIHDKLPKGTYTVKFNDMAGAFYLEMVDNFQVKGKIYGDTMSQVDRILNTFQSREGATGVMLSGEKGSGKTLLAKLLSTTGYEQDIPTIVINQPWCGDVFNGFMQSIEQPVIVIFDEFEKVYDQQEQEKMLTLLDGVYTSKKLFVITCNDSYRINGHMKNRPGRIFYRLDYTGLTQDFIIEYCEDNLKNKEHIPTMCRVALLFGEFNFDLLKAMVEEMNRYNETPQQVMTILNAKPEGSDSSAFKVALKVGKKTVPVDKLDESFWHGNPLVNAIVIDYKVDEDDWTRARFTGANLTGVDPATGKFTFRNEDGSEVVLSKIVQEEPRFDWFLS